MSRRRIAPGWILAGILGIVVLSALLAPSESETGGSYSTYSAGPVGARVAYDLASRLGWSSRRREVEFTADTGAARIQALLQVTTGAVEAHALLEHARRGGALLVVGEAGALGDSLPVIAGDLELTPQEAAGDCPSRDPFENLLHVARPIAPVRWSRPAPPDTVGFGFLDNGARRERAAIGFPYGAGRIIVVADADFLSNDVLRVCSTEADVTLIHMLEYLSGGPPAAIAFDEFHHGRGVHGGSLAAVQQYVGSTPSGRLLGQLVIAGLLFLMAVAPRPLEPRDPLRIARRSPLEHADALAHAYTAVGATRTATARLLAGVRRRTRRGRMGRESDEQVLAAAVSAVPEAQTAAALVTRALAQPVTARELPAVATALQTIENALSSRPSNRKS